MDAKNESIVVANGSSLEPVFAGENEVSSKLSVEERGEGDTCVILLPGIGDVKESYRALAELLESKYRVVSMDLRGQGASSLDFSDFTPEAVGRDVVEWVDHNNLDRVILVGNSMTAASSIFVATERPDQIHSLVLTGPFVRNIPIPWYMNLALQILFWGPWARFFWGSFYRSLHKKTIPEGTEEHIRHIVSGLKEPGRMKVVRHYLFSNRDECMERIKRLRVPSLVVMGGADPDFPDPVAEAKLVAEMLKGEYRILSGVGHYPHREEPEQMRVWINELAARR